MGSFVQSANSLRPDTRGTYDERASDSFIVCFYCLTFLPHILRFNSKCCSASTAVFTWGEAGSGAETGGVCGEGSASARSLLVACETGVSTPVTAVVSRGGRVGEATAIRRLVLGGE